MNKKVEMRYSLGGNSEILTMEFDSSIELMQWVINNDSCHILTIHNEGRLVYERKDIA